MKHKNVSIKFGVALISLIAILLIGVLPIYALAFGNAASGSLFQSSQSGDGSASSPYLIRTADDWDALAESVLSGQTYANKYFKLTDDISVTQKIGSADITSATAPVYAFSGIFDGDGHTLDFNPAADSNADYVAPFSIVKNAVIRNLKVTGKITANNNLSGLVGSLQGTLLAENILSEVNVTGNFVGGFIGHGSVGDITLRSCAFAGDLKGNTVAGGLICWRGPTQWDSLSTSAVHMESCLFAGTASGSADFHPIGFTQQTNVTSGFSGIWASTGGKNNGKGFYNYQYQGASYKSAVATVTNDGISSASRPWMGYCDVTYFAPVEGTLASALSAWPGYKTLALLGNVTTTGAVPAPSGKHTLDLNGHDIKAGSTGYSVITVGSGAELTVDDTHQGGRITGGSVGQNYGGGVTVDGGTLTLKGGAISGNANTYGGIGNCGGGVHVKNGGSFTMEGGEISGNTSYVGGGVCTDSSATTVILTGGVIQNNKTDRFGSAVWAGRGSTAVFQIGGDVQIISNVSTWTGDKDGEGTINFGSKLTLSGDPEIHGDWKTSGTSAPNTHINLDNSGSSVQLITLDGALTNTAGTPKITISPIYRWNDMANGKSFVFTSGWSEYMGDADPADYFVCGNPAYKIFLNSSGEAEVGTPPAAHIINGETVTSYGSLSDALNAWSAGSTLKLLSDVTTDSTITVPTGEHTLDLSGYELKRTGATGADNSGLVITVNDGVNLTVTGPGKITGGSGFHGGGIHVEGNSSLVLDNCEISGNTGHYGGGLYLKNGTITLKNGTVVKGNSASDGFGGSGIYAEGGGTLILEDSKFINNEIKNNNQYAVFLAGNANIKVSGAPVINDNTYGGKQKDLYLYQAGDQHSNVQVIGELTDGAKIIVGQTTGTGVIGSGWKANMGDVDPADYLVSADTDYVVFASKDDELEIGYPEITGVSAEGFEGDYDGEAHKITVTAPDGATIKYGTSEGSYTLSENPTYTDAGTYTVYYEVSKNKYRSTYGSADVKINKINATVTITGHTLTVDYNGSAHSADGYDAVASSDLYDVNKDFTFSGRAEAIRTNVGTTKMNLSADKFKNTNTNFANVTFNVTDGFLTVNPVDAVVTTAPASANPIYNGSDLSMVKTGVVDGGTLYYAINQDPKNSPADSDFATAVPTAKETGSYYVWYKVKSDANHNDLSPVAVRVILAEKDWVKLNGSLYQSDGATTVGDAVVTLMKGNQKIDYAITDKDGQYLFIVPAGVYSVVAEYQQNTQTAMVTLFADKTENTVLSGGKTESRLQVDSNGGSAFYVAVGGLDEEARAIRKDGNIPADTSVSVLMTVASKSETAAQNAESISAFAKNKALIFFDAEVEKTVDSTTTVLHETANVLEIAVPYEKVGKRGIAVYYSDGVGTRELKESASKEEGTFFVDKANGMVYIYSNRFSTFAIGYTPYYQVSSSASLGSFQGTVTVTLTSEDDKEVFKIENVAMENISFADVPKGQYTMTVTWVDGVENTLTFPITISDEKADAPELYENTPGTVLASSFRRTDSFTPVTFAGIKTSAPSGSPLTLAATTGRAIGSDGVYADTFDAFGPKRFFLPVLESKRESLRV